MGEDVSQSEVEQRCIKSHRKIPRSAVLVFEDFDLLIAFGHAEEVALDVGLALRVNKPSSHQTLFKHRIKLKYPPKI